MALSHVVYVFTCYILLSDVVHVLGNQHSLSWFDAQDICRLKNASLFDSVPRYANLTGKVWIGKYRRLSSWIKILGCYTEESVKSAFTTIYEMQKGSAGFCQEICTSFNMTMFAIKLKECRCLTKFPPTEIIKAPPFECDAVCYENNERTEEPYFDECGGNTTYTVFQSASNDERAAGSDVEGSPCVAVDCSPSTLKFHFEGNCSLPFQPQCRMNISVSGSWMKSMRLCKSNISFAYVSDKILLNDINQTCSAVGQGMANTHWLGVAKEVYNGHDLGLTIREQEKNDFIGCHLCSYETGVYKGCSPIYCNGKYISSVLCLQIEQENSSVSSWQKEISLNKSTTVSNQQKKETTPILPVSKTITSTKAITIPTTETLRKFNTTIESTVLLTLQSAITTSKATQEKSSSREPNAQTESTLSLLANYTPIQTIEKTVEANSYEKKEAFEVIVPIMIAVFIGGGIFIALIFIYFCYCKKKIKTKRQTQLARQGKSEGTQATGLMNYAYFTIELRDQNIKSSSLDNKIESPYTEDKQEMYDHLRDKQSRKNTDDVGNKYDTTKSVRAMKEQYSQSTEGTYDRLGDERCGTNTDDTYHHAFTIIKERSDYDVTEERKQYIHDSAYNHVEIVSNENETDQDSFSNLSEKQNEDHTYFILEQD